MAEPILLSWSGGKDSALMLDRVRRDGHWDVVGLLTVVTQGDLRVSMHSVPVDLIQAQAASLGLELVTVEVPRWPANSVYEQALDQAVQPFRSQGLQTIAFGDLFLEDIRNYRESYCRRRNLQSLFPVWGEDTTRLAREFLISGFRAVVCCADSRKLTADFTGCEYDAQFLQRLPTNVDLCGEHGEFHTFVCDGPGFEAPIPVQAGETTINDGFWYAELTAVQSSSTSERVRERVDV